MDRRSGPVHGRLDVWVIGSSLAALQVTGAVALVRELVLGTIPRQVEQAIGQGKSTSSRRRTTPDLGAGV